MKKKLSPLFLAILFFLSFVGFNTTADAAEVSNSQNEFSVRFSEADYADYNSHSETQGYAYVGDGIFFVAETSNAVGKVTYTYEVTARSGPQYAVSPVTQDAPGFLWTPQYTGTYCVQVIARDEAGHEASTSLLYYINEASKKFSVKFSRADYYDFNPAPENAEFPGHAAVGNHINFTAHVANAVGTVTYKYHVSSQADPKYSIPETVSTSPDYLWIPKYTGIYSVEVFASDEAGHESSVNVLYSIHQ